MAQDNGNWLSAEQAVMPDGSERQDLPLIHKKLPQLSPQQGAEGAATAAPDAAPQTSAGGAATP